MRTLQGGDRSIVQVLLLVAATAVLGGMATRRFHTAVLVALCAPGGAGLVLSGAALAFPDTLGFLRVPTSGIETTLASPVRLALAIAGLAGAAAKAEPAAQG
jgi:hypothetical protein